MKSIINKIRSFFFGKKEEPKKSLYRITYVMNGKLCGFYTVTFFAESEEDAEEIFFFAVNGGLYDIISIERM